MLVATFSSLVLLLAAEAAASTDGKAKPNSEEKVCKTTYVVNSRIPKRICMTRAEWDQMEEDVQQAERSSRNRTNVCGESSRC
jgi:Spy/CpxP family protein refolding chaperone